GGHQKKVLCFAWSPDGKALFSGAADASGISWDVASGKPAWQVDGYKAPIQWAYYSKDGSKLAITSTDSHAALWSAEGKQLAIYPHSIGGRSVGNEMMGVMFVGSKGDELITARKTGEMDLYKVGDTKPVHTFSYHKADVREIRVSADGRYAATYASDRTLGMWDIDGRKRVEITPAEGDPTAADFSADSQVFWLGYAQGEIYRFDVKTGKATSEKYGDVAIVGQAMLLDETDPYLWLTLPFHDQGSFYYPERQFIFNINSPSSSGMFRLNLWEVQPSPDGRMFASNWRKESASAEVFYAFDLMRNKGLIELKNRASSFAWSPQRDRLATAYNGEVAEWDVTTGGTVHSWKWDMGRVGSIEGMAYHPNGKWVFTTGHKDDKGILWDITTGENLREFAGLKQMKNPVIAPNGKLVVLWSLDRFVVLDLENGKEVFVLDDTGKKYEERSFTDRVLYTPDSKLLLYRTRRDVRVIDTATGKQIATHSLGNAEELTNRGPFALDKTGSRLLMGAGSKVEILDPRVGKVLMELPHSSEVTSGHFVLNDTRIITTGEVDGVTIWDPTKPVHGAIPQPRKAANLVVMNNHDWLVYDDQGRFDAKDPSNISGAYFILEWAGGLEPIAMPQLKSQFYEPNLMAKALGLDKETLRDVPSLESLRLYPELSIKKNANGALDIEAKERDNGGVGRINVSLNGKQVLSKKSSAYVQFDLSQYTAFLLPETRLPAGQGNLLSVTATNERGDLTSAPTVFDVGVPEGLKAPDVRLFALTVGVGDYAGTGGDLNAPPSDARSLAKAIQEVGERLLPGRSNVTVLATDETDPQGRPTRQRILEWFGKVSKEATSSDILLVFFAGHGVSKIGEQSGYFFLTSEANPSDVTPAVIGSASISGEDLRKALSEVAANKQVVILDTCHSGAAGDSLLSADRSVSGEYQRAWEAIKDTTGTWLLAGSAADQLSYESANVEHGMLTYSLLEAIDKASAEGLRQTPSGELFVDVERWLNYAANRVESLKSEVGLKGVQRPEFKRSTKGASFDIGVTSAERRGALNLKPPKPIVIVGTFQQDEEDPISLETEVQKSMRDSKALKAWFDISKHPNVYRLAGNYTVEGEKVKVKLYLQRFDSAQARKTLKTIDLEGMRSNLASLAESIRKTAESEIDELEVSKTGAGKPQ
ncbi:MAG TPA: caspase family protein, partial [Fimbriimonadaceae bacterium]|nr:caspase family protein [Fimbriimonadaceae bacterium]